VAAIDIKKNDTVKVIAGRDRGKQGRVLSVDPDKGRVLVEHVMMVKRHTRRNPAKQIKGGIAERESPIAVSNLMIVCPSCGPVRMAHHVSPDGRRTRVCRKCGTTFDRK
jgi:large subunit ribosomal protein L24